MPNPILAVAGIQGGVGLIGAKKASDAAKSAGAAEVQAAQLGIEEQRRQFDKVMDTLAPFVTGGSEAFQRMGALAGLGGRRGRAEAIQAIAEGPEFKTAMGLAEDAILANASATGGLRGGNTQRALGELAPAILSSLVEQQYGRLGGLAGMGQASAAGQAAAAQSTGANVSGLLGQIGAAQAGSALGAGQAWQRGLGSLGSAAGYVGGFLPEMPEGQNVFGRWGF